MAHQARKISWDALTSNLIHRSSTYANAEMASNLYFRFRPEQGKQIGDFTESFIQTLEEQTQCERQKYPNKYNSFKPDDLILDDRIAEKIRPLAYRWRKTGSWGDADSVKNTRGLCEHTDSDNFDLVNALLVFGEMDTVLRLCSHPKISLAAWMCERQCYCMEADLGWDQVFEAALDIYLLLNILYCHPELWDPDIRQANNKKKSDEYRGTMMYQRSVKYWTHCESERSYKSQNRLNTINRDFDSPCRTIPSTDEITRS
ncbi:hypothetical protein BO71DRAFT_481510 [Aspergillus ellipticus CBS 707.79]|uniref:Uncharacterized protein n=1 Tax=Aspergillus ellipticus CBS 707.79 TaxID=1448320 RepID=A0A319E011_9EURO|nr:hypothetical protein BO71DRAFT_481510 [Aspergillus ellipticus CBS 707.79]